VSSAAVGAVVPAVAPEHAAGVRVRAHRPALTAASAVARHRVSQEARQTMPRLETGTQPQAVTQPSGPDAPPVADPAEVVRQVHSEHSGAVLAYVLQLTAGDRHRAEDIVQETLLRAWRHAGALRSDRGSVRAWLMRVAHNLTVDAYRARRARPVEVGLDAVGEPAVVDGADEVLASVDVGWALAQLTPEHRAVLVEVYLNDRTVPETAGVLGIPVGTVKSRTYYALRVLRLLLDEERERAR